MNKQRTLFSFALVALALQVQAQTKIEKFCEVTTTPKNGWTAKRVSYLSTGLQPDLFLFKDSTVVTKLQKVNDLTTDADVLNYMAGLGWSFVSIIPMPNLGEKLYFKKEFDKAELVNN